MQAPLHILHLRARGVIEPSNPLTHLLLMLQVQPRLLGRRLGRLGSCLGCCLGRFEAAFERSIRSERLLELSLKRNTRLLGFGHTYL